MFSFTMGKQGFRGMHLLYSALIFVFIFHAVRALKHSIPKVVLTAQRPPLPYDRKSNPEPCAGESALLKCVLGMKFLQIYQFDCFTLNFYFGGK